MHRTLLPVAFHEANVTVHVMNRKRLHQCIITVPISVRVVIVLAVSTVPVLVTIETISTLVLTFRIPRPPIGHVQGDENHNHSQHLL